MSGHDQKSPEQVCEALIWAHNPDGLASAEDADPRSWGGSVQADVRAAPSRQDALWPTEAAEPCQSVVAIMMVKDEGDIIEENIRWLYFGGIRKFLVLDNGSTDETGKILHFLAREMQGAELLILDDPTTRYLQAQKMTGLFRLALSIWPEVRWVIPADADEFFIAQRGLAVLDEISPDVQAVTIPKSIHFLNKIQKYQIDNLFFSRMDLCSPIFEVPPKIILRADLALSITQGNHMITAGGDVPRYDGGFKYGLYYREYPVRSFEHFLKKTRNGGRAVKAAQVVMGDSAGGGHWLQTYEILQKGGEAALLRLYESNWVSDTHERFRFRAFRGIHTFRRTFA